MGKNPRDEYLKNTSISAIDFLPERPYAIEGVKAIPRKGTHDFFMFFVSREQNVKPHLVIVLLPYMVDILAS
jgi:hypothetical protein